MHAVPNSPSLSITILTSPSAAAKAQSSKDQPQKLAQYLPEERSEAFVGPVLDDLDATLRMIKEQCPSLRHVATDKIQLRMQTDGKAQKALKGVKLRILSEAWPNAVSVHMPLLHVKVTRDSFSLNPTPSALPLHAIAGSPDKNKGRPSPLKVAVDGSQGGPSTRAGGTSASATMDRSETPSTSKSWEQCVAEGVLLGA